MDKLVSCQQSSLLHQLKFLLQVPSEYKQQQTLNLLNQIYPFIKWPLTQLPPFQFIQCLQQTHLSDDLAKQFQSYCYVIIKGQIILRKETFQHTQTKFLHPDNNQNIPFIISSKTVSLKAPAGTVLIKIHQLWVKRAQEISEENTKKYIRKKLLSIPFFGTLTFQEFDAFCKKASILTLGPGQCLLKQGFVPYHMYIIAEGELIFTKIVEFTKDPELWKELNHQLKFSEEGSSVLLEHLTKNPQKGQETFKIKFQVACLGEGNIICGKETLNQEKIDYEIISSLKSKIICVKYPDLYVLCQDKLTQIRSWKSNQIDLQKIRKEYYFSLKWQEYRKFLKNQVKLSTWNKLSFDDFLRKSQIILNQPKHQYFPDQIGDSNFLNSPADRLFRLKDFTSK